VIFLGQQDFVAKRNGSRLFQHGRDRTIFFFAQLDGMLDRGGVELAAQLVNQLEPGPYHGRLGGALAGHDNFERLELLPLFLENDDDIGGRASTERDEEHLHGSRGGVGLAIGVERDSVS